MNVIKCEVGLFFLSWNVAKAWKLRTIGNKQVIDHIGGKTSPKTITPTSIDDQTKHLKTDYMKKALLKQSCWSKRIAAERNWRCNLVGRSWQRNYKSWGLQPIASVGTCCSRHSGYAEGDEGARVSLKDMWSIAESQHLDSWHNRGHIGADLRELEKQAFVPLFLFPLFPCLDFWGDRNSCVWGWEVEVEQTSKGTDHTHLSHYWSPAFLIETELKSKNKQMGLH